MLSHRITSTGLAVMAAATLGVTPGAVARPAQDLRSPDARDAASGPVQDLRAPDTRDVATRGATQQRGIPAPRIVAISPDGFDWGDAGVGAGGALGLVLIVTGTGAALVRRRATHRVEIAP
jgi:hypothetical protein